MYGGPAVGVTQCICSRLVYVQHSPRYEVGAGRGRHARAHARQCQTDSKTMPFLRMPWACLALRAALCSELLLRGLILAELDCQMRSSEGPAADPSLEGPALDPGGNVDEPGRPLLLRESRRAPQRVESRPGRASPPEGRRPAQSAAERLRSRACTRSRSAIAPPSDTFSVVAPPRPPSR